MNENSSVELSLSDKDLYIGNKKLTKEKLILFNYKNYKGSFLNFYCKYIKNLRGFRKIRTLPFYDEYRNILVLKDFLYPFWIKKTSYSSSDFLLYMGEEKYKGGLPVIRKARSVNDKNSVLFKLGTIRHFLPCKEIKKADIDWKKKKSGVVWRGATTSQKYREKFVLKYFDKYDIGFSSTKQNTTLDKYKLERLSIKEQLKYKFIVSLEGYDVASNLKWILYSNSVPIMTKPNWVSWIMEDKLKPYIHYLPLEDDLSNLEDLMLWANNNLDKCKLIAENGKKYMSQFFNSSTEDKVMKMVLESYTKKIKIHTRQH